MATFNLLLYFHLSLSMDCLAFLTAWLLDSKSKYPKRVRCMTLLWPSLRSHLMSVLMSSVVQGSHDALSSFKGRKCISPLVQEVQDCIYTCNVFLQRSLENTICHTYCLNEQRFKRSWKIENIFIVCHSWDQKQDVNYFLNVFLISFCLQKYFHCERMKSLPET